ncbi:Calcium-binding protein [Actinidia chinensis var. chinensis]|uniref:Calcium-binding protein n=1 Tax=Actinidia chinensis var. chinensis TaxID=1590841 RepID=A0A2R6PGN4_ACTCC|nr:Calcium-binding protein [Actinidia chinensis var. chinensis]
MGFKSLFRKKKRGSLSIAGHSPAASPMVSRCSSLNSRAQIEEEMKQVFKKFDVNDDGKISAGELGSILGSLGYAASAEELEAMIREVDSDGDGCIDLDEFIELNTKDIDSSEVLENLKEAFSVFDIDKNGSISAEELQNVLSSLGDECSIAECRKMINGVDCDGDGMINFEEFKVMMVKGSRFDAMEGQRPSVKIE